MKYLKYAVVVLVGVLAVLVVFLIHDYFSLRRAQLISGRELWISNILHDHGPVTASDVSFIRSWMTFTYINTLFHLPTDYIQTQLSITDPRYPKVSIASYANRYHIDSDTFISELDAAITNYLGNASST